MVGGLQGYKIARGEIKLDEQNGDVFGQVKEDNNSNSKGKFGGKGKSIIYFYNIDIYIFSSFYSTDLQVLIILTTTHIELTLSLSPMYHYVLPIGCFNGYYYYRSYYY